MLTIRDIRDGSIVAGIAADRLPSPALRQCIDCGVPAPGICLGCRAHRADGHAPRRYAEVRHWSNTPNSPIEARLLGEGQAPPTVVVWAPSGGWLWRAAETYYCHGHGPNGRGGDDDAGDS